jgi:hypothetical protein
MIDNRSAPPGPVVPVLAYDHVEKAIEWLSGAFGFTERLRIIDSCQGREGVCYVLRKNCSAGRSGIAIVDGRVSMTLVE